MSKPAGDYTSPLGPGQEAIGQVSPYASDVKSLTGMPNDNVTPVMKGSSKDSSAEPSLGTANVRAVAMERSGARYRVHPASNYAQPNHPSSGATLSNTVAVDSAPGVDPNPQSVEYGPGVNQNFDDAEVAGGRPGGTHRQRGYSAPPRG